MKTLRFAQRNGRATLAALALGVSAMALAGPALAETTLTAVMEAPLRSLDPVITTSYIVRNYGYMVYDTLLAEDADGEIRPQMLEGWQVSEDGRTYTFTLREGLAWHDGNPVVAEDAVASINRWIQLDKMGQILAEFVVGIAVVDDRSFTVELSVASDLVLRALAKPSSLPAFVMPAAVAATPVSEPITSSIGSGPFRFVEAEYSPGVRAVFERNEAYVPRDEPASGLAGGKVVHVDRVEWVAMPDAMTAVNALRNGEIDLIEQVRLDLLPLFEGDPAITLSTSTIRGGQSEMRFNFLHPPFDDRLARQAALMALDQTAMMQAQVGNPDYFQTCGAIFGCSSRFPSEAGSEGYFKGDIEAAKALLEQSDYDGEPVALLHPTDFLTGPLVPVIAHSLRQAGFTVNMESMDWQTVQTRRTSTLPVGEGGWSILTTYSGLADIGNPLSFMGVAANGPKAWFGWPDFPAIEERRMAFAQAGSAEEAERLATEIQELVMQDGVIIPLGEFKVITATRDNVTGFLDSAVPVFWNVEKQ